MLRSFFDIGERELALGVRYPSDLIEARERIPNVLRVGERLFALFRKGVNAVG
jgi:hypothetical protein